MPTPESKTVDIGNLVPINPQGVLSVYTNNVGLSATPWDVRMLFSEIVIDGTEPRAELRASVVMSLPHARAFLEALKAAIPGMEAAAAANAAANLKAAENAAKPAKSLQ